MGLNGSKHFYINLQQKDSPDTSQQQENTETTNANTLDSQDKNLPKEIKNNASSTSFIKNPGTIDEIQKDFREILPNFNEGINFTIYNNINNSLQLSHQIRIMSHTNDESCYRLGAAFVGSSTNFIDSATKDSFPILHGELSPNGCLQANFIHKMLNDSVRLRIALALSKNSSIINSTYLADYFGDTFTASFGIVNPNFINFSGALIFQYLKSITDTFSLGTEIGHRFGPSVTDNGNTTALNTISKYKKDQTLLTTSFGAGGLHLGYMKECSSQLKVCAELHSNFDAETTFSTIGYEITLPKCEVTIRSSIDTKWNVCSVLEKKLSPLPCVFSLSAIINHRTNKLRLGCGLTVG